MRFASCLRRKPPNFDSYLYQLLLLILVGPAFPAAIVFRRKK